MKEKAKCRVGLEDKFIHVTFGDFHEFEVAWIGVTAHKYHLYMTVASVHHESDAPK